MYNLFQFSKFDFDLFVKEKKITVTSVSDWTEYGTMKHLGTKIVVCITEDKTTYFSKDGKTVSNLMEKFNVKVTKDVTVSVGDVIELVNPTAKAYGKRMPDGSWSKFKDQLSVTCDDIVIVTP